MTEADEALFGLHVEISNRIEDAKDADQEPDAEAILREVFDGLDDFQKAVLAGAMLRQLIAEAITDAEED